MVILSKLKKISKFQYSIMKFNCDLFFFFNYLLYIKYLLVLLLVIVLVLVLV